MGRKGCGIMISIVFSSFLYFWIVLNSFLIFLFPAKLQPLFDSFWHFQKKFIFFVPFIPKILVFEFGNSDFAGPFTVFFFEAGSSNFEIGRIAFDLLQLVE